MRLLHREDGLLRSDHYNKPPRYAILSHTWGRKDDEVSYLDIVMQKDVTTKPGYQKLMSCLTQAEQDGIQHVWIDTCCINSQDNKETSEDINRMFEYYRCAALCYVYMQDVNAGTVETSFLQSRWFTRGWTLQELVAPSLSNFYSHDWTFLGSRTTLSGLIQTASGIDITQPTGSVSPVDRFVWSFNRETTRAEDMSYCMLGILEVSINTFPGEGAQAAQDRLLDAVAAEHGRRVSRVIQKRLLLHAIEKDAEREAARRVHQWIRH